MEERRKAFRVVVRKPRGKSPIERPKLLTNNIKMDIKGNRMAVDWIHLVQNMDP